MLLCAKKSYAASLLDDQDVSSKKSFNSIQGYLATKNLQKIAHTIPFPPCVGFTAFNVFQTVSKLVKLFCKQKAIYGSNLCYLNGMSIQILTMRVLEIVYLPSY